MNHSTISREVGRNRIRDNHYLPEVDHAKAIKRRCQAGKYGIPEQTITFVKFGLKQKWSPEQIACVGKIIGHPVSHEWIYGFVQRDKLRGGKLFKQLRHGHRDHRKGSRAKRVIIRIRLGLGLGLSVVRPS